MVVLLELAIMVRHDVISRTVNPMTVYLKLEHFGKVPGSGYNHNVRIRYDLHEHPHWSEPFEMDYGVINGLRSWASATFYTDYTLPWLIERRIIPHGNFFYACFMQDADCALFMLRWKGAELREEWIAGACNFSVVL